MVRPSDEIIGYIINYLSILYNVNAVNVTMKIFILAMLS